MNHVFLLLVFFTFHSSKALIDTLTNDNYIKYIRNATKSKTHDYMIACFDEAKQREVIVSFLVMYDDVLSVHKNRTKFAYCNTAEAFNLLQAIVIKVVPSVVLIHKGVAYHLYGSKNVLNKKVLLKFATEYKKMKERVTRLPMYLLPKGYRPELPEKEKPWESMKHIGIVRYLSTQLETLTSQTWDKNKVYLGIILALPIICGLVLMIIGWYAEQQRRPAEKVKIN